MLRERWPPWKAGLYVLEKISPWRCNFRMGRLAYDTLYFTNCIYSYLFFKSLSKVATWVKSKVVTFGKASSSSLLWDTLDTNNFYFILFYFFWFYMDFLFILDDREAHDMEVTWQVTWCDVISLEHSGRVWKMMSGHMEITWWSWVGNEINIRMQHGYKGRTNY